MLFRSKSMSDHFSPQHSPPPAHPGGDDEFIVGFVLETLVFQCGDDFLHCLLISNQFIFFLAGVFVGAPSGIVIQESTLHRIRQDSTEAGVDTFDGMLGDRQTSPWRLPKGSCLSIF